MHSLRHGAPKLRLHLVTLLLAWSPCLMAQKAPAVPNVPLSTKATLTHAVGMTFVKIPAGQFLMGCSNSTPLGLRDAANPPHAETVAKAFYLQTTEVTQGQWQAVMGTTPWRGQEHVREGGDYPAVFVSWDDAQAFLAKLNAKGDGTYRLPTATEWEYACRAGTRTPYSFGEDEANLGAYAWFGKNIFDVGEPYAHRVGTRRPNPWGLFDLHGNVWEWCQDQAAAPSQGKRILRGGCWYGTAMSCQSDDFCTSEPTIREAGFGFRVVWSPRPTP